MKDLFAKCGYNCGCCAAYRENAKTDKDRQRGSDGWKKYYNFRISLEKMYCDGCQTPDEENPVILGVGCRIRKCAIMNGVQTCAHCSEYITCMKDIRIHSDIERKKIEDRMGTPIPEEDYIAFIGPFEHLRHLEKIRASLDPKDIKKAKVSTIKPRVVDFPDDLPFSPEETSAYRALYQLLVKIAFISGNTYAQQAELKKRKEYLFKLLWTFGVFGELKQEDGSHLKINSEIYFSHKFIGQWRKVSLCFEILKGYGVHCELVPLTKEMYGKDGWLTPMGWLKKSEWFIKMSFDNKAGGVSALQALKNYTARLEKEYGKQAFGYFKKADMQVLIIKAK